MRVGADYSDAIHQRIGIVVRHLPKTKHNEYHAWRQRRVRELLFARGINPEKDNLDRVWRAMNEIIASPTFIVECMTKVGEIAGES